MCLSICFTIQKREQTIVNIQVLALLRMSDKVFQVCPVEAEQLARIVADCGDEIEQEAREKNAQDPKLW